MNELLENVMRDREKYFLMKCIHSQQEIKEPSALDRAMIKDFESKEQDGKKFMLFRNFMRPTALQLRDACKELYRGYLKVVSTLERQNKSVKAYLGENKTIESMKRRMKIVLWFHKHQYSKQMRNMRDEWIQIIKG